jgi:hypothetical protein
MQELFTRHFPDTGKVQGACGNANNMYSKNAKGLSLLLCGERLMTARLIDRSALRFIIFWFFLLVPVSRNFGANIGWIPGKRSQQLKYIFP